MTCPYRGLPLLWALAVAAGCSPSAPATEPDSSSSDATGPTTDGDRASDAATEKDAPFSDGGALPSDASGPEAGGDGPTGACLSLGHVGCSSNPASPYACCAPGYCDPEEGECFSKNGSPCTDSSECSLASTCTDAGLCAAISCIGPDKSFICAGLPGIPCCYPGAVCSGTTKADSKCCVPDGVVSSDPSQCCGGNTKGLGGACCTGANCSS